MREREIISLFYRDHDGLDDCAMVPGASKQIVSTDAMVEEVHFRLDWSSPEEIATKLFQVNLSDLISSGGLADWCLLNFGLPIKISNGQDENEFILRFSECFKQQCQDHKCSLIGGDTFRSEGIFLSLTMGGMAERYISRQGAEAGDYLYVTGDLGTCSLALQYLQKKRALSKDRVIREQAMKKHLQPQARVDWAKWLWPRPEVHAMLDLSDSLIEGATCLARANSLDIHVDLQAIPIDKKFVDKIQARQAIISGEELELLFLAKPGLDFPFPCHRIGHAKAPISKPSRLKLFSKGQEIPLPGHEYEHFTS